MTTNTFEYRHDATLSQEFVNGGYELGAIQRITIAGREILYRVGSALLDNSCCGNFGCAYGLVIGEELQKQPAQSTVREISSEEPLAEAIRNVLMECESLGVLNFYTSAHPVKDAA
jgi:hypothetical protein